MQIKINNLPNSVVEIEGEIDADSFESYFANTLKELGENIELAGFRKGKAPENVLLANIPEIKILEKMAEKALTENYPKIIKDNKIDAISRPEISITKLARKNPLGFKIKTAILPEIKLPDYKKLAKKVISEIPDTDKNISVSDKEVEDTIMDIRKSRAPKKHISEPHEHKEGEPARNASHSDAGGEHNHDAPTFEEVGVPTESVEKELPEWNDEFVQALGPFKDIADFTEKLKINIKLEKENRAKEKARLNILEKIIEESKMEIPDILVEVELDKIIYKMESDITQMGLKFEDYLKHLNKSVEDIRNEFRKDAEKKAKLGLILNEISKVENLTADKEQVEKEVEQILEHYKDADPLRARMHAENVLTNEKVFEFLESQA